MVQSAPATIFGVLILFCPKVCGVKHFPCVTGLFLIPYFYAVNVLFFRYVSQSVCGTLRYSD